MRQLSSSLLVLIALLWGCSSATLTAEDVPQGGPGVAPPPGVEQGQPTPPRPGTPDPETNPEPGVDPDPVAEPPPPPPPEPLEILIEEPPRGSRGDVGVPIQVVGRVINGPVTSLTVGGNNVVPAADGTFSAELPGELGLNIVVTEATTEDGRLAEDRRAVLVGADDDPGGEVGNGMQIMISTDGFARLNQLLSGFVADLDIDDLIAGQDTGDFNVESVQYSDVTMRLVPRQGFLEIRLTIHGLRLEMSGSVDGPFGIDIGVAGDMRTNALYIDAQLNLNPTPDGGLDMALNNPQIQFEGFDYNLNGVPGFIEDLFEGTVRGMAEDALRDALGGLVVPELFDPAALSQTIDIVGVSVDMELAIRGVEVTYDGMLLTMGGALRVSTPQRNGGALPVNPTPAGMSLGDAIDMSMSSDFVARIMHAMWAAGALDLSIGPGGDVELPGGGGLGLLQSSLGEAGEGIDPSSPLTIGLRPLLPPIAYVDPERERPLVVEMGDLMMDLDVPEGRLASVSTHLILSISLAFDSSNGELAFVPSIVAEAHADVAETPRGRVKERDLERQVGAAVRLIPAALADQTFSLGADALPVPLLFENSRFEADSNGPHVHIRADIVVPDPAMP